METFVFVFIALIISDGSIKVPLSILEDKQIRKPKQDAQQQPGLSAAEARSIRPSSLQPRRLQSTTDGAAAAHQ